MNNIRHQYTYFLIIFYTPLVLNAFCNQAYAIPNDELNSTITVTTSYYTDEPIVGEDRPQISALSFQSELFLDLTDRFQLTVEPFLQYEHLSDINTHLDLRKFSFLYTASSWEFEAGIGQEFWGVAESRQIVDVINQQDFATDFNGEVKLGQPLLRVSSFTPLGDFSAYLLPLFREPEYASTDSRPRVPLQVDGTLSTYESADADKHIDYALRWTNTTGIWDLGLHYFSGTRRQPLFSVVGQNLAQRFVLVEQVGADAQATIGALLAKLELIQQNSREIDNHTELVTGVEYTLSQFLSTRVDVGLLSEFLYDSRNELADHLFQRDLMVGVRLSFNDSNSTSVLLTQVTDVESKAKSTQMEFTRRIGPNFTVGLEGAWWRDTEEDRNLSTLSAEDNVRFLLNWFF